MQKDKESEKIYNVNEVDVKAVIKEYDFFIRLHGSCGGSGKLVLKVTLHKSGKVTNVEILKPSSCNTFNKKHIKAARKIKFESAVKNGEKVSQYLAFAFAYTLPE